MWQQIQTPAPVSPVEPWRYGGHRGGHNRRKDGLCAGSPEAIAADRAKDAERKRNARAAKRAYGVQNYQSPGQPVSCIATASNTQPATNSAGFSILELAIIGLSAVFVGSFALNITSPPE